MKAQAKRSKALADFERISADNAQALQLAPNAKLHAVLAAADLTAGYVLEIITPGLDRMPELVQVESLLSALVELERRGELTRDSNGWTWLLTEARTSAVHSWIKLYPRAICGYVSSDNRNLIDASDNVIGAVRMTSEWRTPRSYVSCTMRQYECRTGIATYTGRGTGEMMSWYGKLKGTR